MEQDYFLKTDANENKSWIFYKKFYFKTIVLLIILSILRTAKRFWIGQFEVAIFYIFVIIILSSIYLYFLKQQNNSEKLQLFQQKSKILGIILILIQIGVIYFFQDNLATTILNIYILDSFSQSIYMVLDFKLFICYKVIISYFYYSVILQYADYQTLTILTMVSLQLYQIILQNDLQKFIKQRINGLLHYQQIVFSQYLDQLFLLKKDAHNNMQMVFSSIKSIQTKEKLFEYLNNLNLRCAYLSDNSQNINHLISSLLDQKNEKSVHHQLFVKNNLQNSKKMNLDILKYQYDDENHILIRFQDVGIQEQLELMRLKEIMVASFNHDLKNPIISGIYVFEKIQNDYLQTGQIDDKYFQIMNFNLQFIVYLLNGYLDYTQAREGNLIISIRQLDIYTSIHKICNLMSFSANQKQIHLDCQFNNKSLICFNDERRIQQVLMNLLNNSIKFTISVGQILVLTTEFISNNLIYIKIIDNGVGISPDILSQLCQPFKTFNQLQMNNYGTGIGLYTSSQIVKKIGPCDKIFITSTLSQGTQCSFFIYLNASNKSIKKEIAPFKNNLTQILCYLTKNSDSVPVENQINHKINTHFMCSQQLQINNNTSSVNVLIVDDDLYLRKMIIDYIDGLKQIHISYKQAQNGEEGLSLFTEYNKQKNQQSFDIILTDIRMPIMDGYQMSHLIQEKIQKENYSKAFIYALSSDDSEAHFRKCRLIKFESNYQKPLSSQEFEHIISKFLQSNLQ